MDAHARAIEAAELKGDVLLQLTAPFHFHHEVEALLRGGDEALAREALRRFGEQVGESPRLSVAYLRAGAVSERCDGDPGLSIERLREAERLAGEIGLLGESWQIKAVLGELYEECGKPQEANQSISEAAEVVRELTGKVEDTELREDFLAAPQIRRVLVSRQ